MSPCLSCGACCASLRVQFHADHVTPRGIVPRSLTVPARAPRHVCMRGTDRGRCIALQGRVGEAVTCGIYDRRPPPCRDFAFSYEHGVASPECDDARARHGLPPLSAPDPDPSSP